MQAYYCQQGLHRQACTSMTSTALLRYNSQTAWHFHLRCSSQKQSAVPETWSRADFLHQTGSLAAISQWLPSYFLPQKFAYPGNLMCVEWQSMWPFACLTFLLHVLPLRSMSFVQNFTSSDHMDVLYSVNRSHMSTRSPAEGVLALPVYVLMNEWCCCWLLLHHSL